MDTTKPLSPAPAPPTEQPLSGGAARWHTLAWARRALLILLLAGALLLAYKATRVGLYGWSAYQSLVELRALASDLSLDGPALDDETLTNLPALADSARLETQQLASAAAGLEVQLRPLTPLLDGLNSLPRYGPTLAAAPELLVAGREFSALAADGLTLAAPALATWDGQSPEALLREAMVDGQPRLAAMAARAQTASDALTSLPAADLLPLLGEPLAQAQPLLPLLAPLLEMSPSLPKLAGFDAPQTYLVVVQNNDELRGPGGFFTSVGEVTVEDARPAEFSFQDSSRVWSRDHKYAAAPEPMQRYMNVGLILLRDANWSPDLPTSARTIRSLYAQERGVQADGLITVDTHAVQIIVEALEPLSVQLGEGDEIETVEVTSENLTGWMRESRDESLDVVDGEIQGDWGGRKDFMPALVDAMLARLQGGGTDYAKLAQAGVVALNQRSIQLWMVDEMAAAQLAQLGWDGALRPPAGENAGDFLALVDSNLGYNKVDAAIERALDYEIEWDENGVGTATATATYTHTVVKPNHQCNPRSRYGSTYEESIARCYFDYVRLYVPGGSKLLSIEGVAPDTVEHYRGERGTQVFAGYFALKPGKRQRLTFRYTLPPAITAVDYALAVQRQSGTRALPFTAQVGEHETATTIVDGRYEWKP